MQSEPRRRRGLLAVVALSSAMLLGMLAVSQAFANVSNTGPATTTHMVHAQLKTFPSGRSCTATGGTLISGAFNNITGGAPTGTSTQSFIINGQTVTITITWYANNSFDFSIGNGVAHAVFVKAQEYRLYQYQPPYNQTNFPGNPDAHATNTGPVSSDTNLVASSNTSPGGAFQDVSHLDFCITPGAPGLDIDKTPDSGTLTVGDKIGWTVIVSNPGTAATSTVSVTDNLQPAGFDFAITSQGFLPTGTGGSACSIDLTLDPNKLTCTFASLAADASYRVIVESTTAIPVGSTLCGTNIVNTADATGTGVPPATDTGTQTVACGAIEVTKVAKNATTSDPNDVIKLQGAKFGLFSGTPLTLVAPPGEKTTNANGVACFDGLPTNTQFTLRETAAPTGYDGADDQTVTSSAANAACGTPNVGSPTPVTVTNTPLTDLDIDVAADVLDGTRSTVSCVDSANQSVGTPITTPVDPANFDADNLAPGTYTCTIVIDP
jgi:uncharacterized repeat protein (TIGR01451 family)